MSVFFSQVGYKPTAEWKEEIVFWDPLGVSTQAGSTAPGQAAVTTSLQPSDDADDDESEPSAEPARIYKLSTAVFPDGTKPRLRPNRDPREVFADWLITPENPWFTRSISNRVWAWLMGRGIVHEPDDIRSDNPPSNPELMAFLEKELIANDYDLKHLYRLILTSSTYQLSSMPLENHPEAANDPLAEANFARYPLRRLDAEVLIDAVNQITGTSDLYTSAIPEPFTYIPRDQPAIALADGSITSPFLALFGRSARATGMENERNNRALPSQWLHMLNSGHIQTKLERGPALKAIFASRRKPAAIAEHLYLTILSRKPTDEELKTVASYVQSASSKRNQAAIDIAWALINSPEFLYRH
jgi:hypothetical protein